MNKCIRCACEHPDLSANINRQFHLVRIPEGPLTRDHFRPAIVEGFDNLPGALIGLLHGKDRGKRMAKIG